MSNRTRILMIFLLQAKFAVEGLRRIKRNSSKIGSGYILFNYVCDFKFIYG